MSQYFNLSFSSSQGSRVTISKNANCGPCKHSHYFNTGGSSADMDDKYKGPCCGGTRMRVWARGGSAREPAGGRGTERPRDGALL